jgi:hypothetical protein
MPILFPKLPGELVQWSLGCTATATLILAAETGDWKLGAYALAVQLYGALVGWRAAEIRGRNGGNGKG